MATIIGTSLNNIPVFLHPESHSHRPDLNAEVIGKIVLPEHDTFYRNTIDIGRVIGKDHLVKTDKHDTIVYLQRGNRSGMSRMVLKEADDTSFVTIIACVAVEEEGTPAELVGKWILVTLFEGKQGEREPFDRAFADGKNPEGLKRSEDFWATHALVPTDEELEQINISDEKTARAIARMLVYEMDLDFMERVQVSCATDSDIINFWGRWNDPINTIEEIRGIIEEHIDGYARNPDGYDY